MILLPLCSNAQSKKYPHGLQPFKNIEQIEYCVLLPINEYKETFDTERAQHSFVNKKNKDLGIELRGYYSVDKQMPLNTLCNLKYTNKDEEQGKIIKTKHISEADHCYYVIGYYNNFIYKYEFIEITWVRNDEVVVLEIHYDLKDKALWQDRLYKIIKNADCK